MKNVIFFFFFIMILGSKEIKAQETGQKFDLCFITTTNGMAPIPAFTLGKPAGLVFTNIKPGKNGRFVISPNIAFALKHGDLWFIDMWLKYTFNLGSKEKWNLTMGIDYPSYVGESTIGNNGKRITKVSNYPTSQMCIKRKIGQNYLSLDYWYMHAADPSIDMKGSYLSVNYYVQKNLKNFSFITNPNIFYLNFSDGTKGFVGSADIRLVHKSGLFVSAQGMMPLQADKVKSGWNVSAGFSLKI